MSDKVKLIIEIPKKVFEARKIGEISPWVTVPILDAVQNGIPLDEIKAEIDREYEELDGYDPSSLGTFAEKVDNILDKYKAYNRPKGERAESEVKPNEKAD